MTKNPSIFISVGEFSGDLLAAELCHELRRQHQELTFFGITGPELLRLKVDSLATIDDLGMMGVFDVAKKLSDILLLKKRVLEAIDRRKPDWAILVDFPGFHLDLARELKLRGVRVVQYVAPKMWAWGAHRAKSWRAVVDHIVGVLPFEEAFFREHQLPYTYVGTPHLDRVNKISVSKEAFGFASHSKIVVILPGSRLNEWRHHASLMLLTAEELRKRFVGLTCIVPVSNNIQYSDVEKVFGKELTSARVGAIDGRSLDGMLYFVKDMTLEMIKMADVCLAGSGTVTLECGLMEKPMVVFYVADLLSYSLYKTRATIQFISLVNLILGRKAIEELVQEFSYLDLVERASELLTDDKLCEKMKKDLRDLRFALKPNAARTAAQLIDDLIRKSRA